MNPIMTVHPICTANVFLPNYRREAFTRLRLMSHNPEIFVCQCDDVVETEKHSLIDCPLAPWKISNVELFCHLRIIQ